MINVKGVNNHLSPAADYGKLNDRVLKQDPRSPPNGEIAMTLSAEMASLDADTRAKRDSLAGEEGNKLSSSIFGEIKS